MTRLRYMRSRGRDDGLARTRQGRRLQALVTAICALALIGTSCGSQTTAPVSIRHGGILVFGQEAQADSLDATSTFINEAIWDELQVYETLYAPTPDGQSTQPRLATSYDLSPDKLTWTFHLRPGVKFSNGQLMTSTDVKFSIEQAKAGNAWGFIYTAFDKIEAPDAQTVVIHTTTPWIPVLADLSLFAAGVVPANWGGQSHDQFYAHPIGTGPFMLQSWTKGQELKFVRNPYYWQSGKPYLDGVTFTNVADDNTRTLQLKGGQSDIAEFPPVSAVDSLRHTSGVTVNIFPSSRTDLLYLNTRKPPFQDANVRQAIAYAIDRAGMVKAVQFGFGSPANSFISPTLPYYDPKTPGPQLDVAKAKQLMASSTVPNGFKTTLLIASGAASGLVGQIIQQDLKAIGIDVSIVAQDQNTAFTNLQNFKYDMMQFYWTTDIPDPDELIGGYVDTAGQWTGLVSQSTKDWTTQAESAFDPTVRGPLYSKIQAQVAVDSSVIALYYSPYIYAVSNKVHGFQVGPTGNFPLENVWLSS